MGIRNAPIQLAWYLICGLFLGVIIAILIGASSFLIFGLFMYSMLGTISFATGGISIIAMQIIGEASTVVQKFIIGLVASSIAGATSYGLLAAIKSIFVPQLVGTVFGFFLISTFVWPLLEKKFFVR